MVAALRAALCVAILLGSERALAQDQVPSGSTRAALDEGPAARDLRGAQATSPGESESRRVFEQGLRLLRAGQWIDAEASFRRSLALSPRPSASYNLAFVLYKQGRARESAEILQRLLTAPATTPDTRYREYAGVLLAEVVTQHLSTLRIVVDPPTADIRIDGTMTPSTGAAVRSIQLDLGAHQLEASAPGFVTQRLDLIAEPHAEIERRLTLSPLRLGTDEGLAPAQPDRAPTRSGAPQAAQPNLRTVAPWLAIGVGGALLAGAAVTGILAKQADDTFARACPSLQHCDPTLMSTRDRAVQFGHITDALLVSGGAVAAAGITWHLLLQPAAPTAARGQVALLMASGAY